LIYIFLIPDTIGKDTLVKLLPEIKILGEAEANLPPGLADQEIRAFTGKAHIGYYSAKGNLTALLLRDLGSLVEDEFAILRTGNTKEFSFIDLKNKKSRVIGEEGLPLAFTGNPFMMRNDQMGVSKLGKDGAVLWRYEFGKIVTGASIAHERSAFGTLSGEAIVLDGKGLPLYIIDPSAFGLSAKYSCIYGISLSPDGSMLAMLHDLEPQRLTIFNERGSGWGILASTVIKKESPYPRESMFSNDGSQGLFDSGEGLIHFDAEEKEFRHIPLEFENVVPGKSMISPLGDDGFAFLANFKHANNFGLVINGVLRASFPVGTEAATLNVREGEVDIIGEAEIMRLFVDSGIQ
jgi:hypothetical protein